jgi:hypothetical protein
MLVPAYQSTRHKPKVHGWLAALLLNILEAPNSNPSPKTRQAYSSVLRENFWVRTTTLVITVPFHILSNQSYINHRVIWRCKIWDFDGVAKWTTNNTQCVTSGHKHMILVALLLTAQSHTGARCCFYLPPEFVTAWEIRSLNLLKKCNIVYFLARKFSDKRGLNNASHCEMTHQPTFTRSNMYSHRKLLLISIPSPHAANCTLHLTSAFFRYGF